MNPAFLAYLRDRLDLAKTTLEANKKAPGSLGNDLRCMAAKHRIAELELAIAKYLELHPAK